MLTIALLLLTPPDLAHLGADDFHTRELAEVRCKLLWPLILPDMLHAERHSPSPEIRERCRRVLSEYRDRREDERARRVLFDPWPLTPMAFWDDHALRRRVVRAAVRFGAAESDAAEMLPEWYDRWEWWWGWSPVLACHQKLVRTRRRLGTRAGWPFD